MTWQGIQGHDAVVERFRRASARGRLAGSFLFIGPSGIGKRHFALALARGVLCKGNETGTIDPCGHCESCRLFGITQSSQFELDNAQSPHPDLYFVSKPADKSFLPLELLIGDREHRGRTGLCYNISRTPFLGHRKVAVIDDADFLNAEGANALLKTLEEPPPDSLIILISSSSAKQLPTIRSRCQMIRFAPLSSRMLANLLVEQGIVSSLEQGLALAKRSGGSLDQAKEFYDDSIDNIQAELNRALLSSKSPGQADSLALAAHLEEFIGRKNKEAAPEQRRRLRLVLNLAIDFYRERFKKLERPPREGEGADVRLRHENSCQLMTRQLERTLDALEQVDRNANLGFLIDAWCDDLVSLR